ncbi:MAG: hypothetical protein LDL41_00110 [Coleofasciculus sp. S288]|nr:hypothetical protein [Coleofasciculus sp. S288]
MNRLHKFLTAPIAKSSSSPVKFWFSLSLTFAAIYGLLVLQHAFSSEYVVQDDARQHVFWMQRFIDPQLFPGDLIADYFQSVAPAGYTALYRLMASLGIEPLLLSKLLPLILGLITTGYCFGVSLQLLPVPLAGFIGSLLLNHYLWMRDDLVSATAVAFIYPLFLAFLYYLLRRSLLPCCIAIALLGLFYPQGVFICIGILILRVQRWEKGRPYFLRNPREYRLYATGLGVAALVIAFYAFKSSSGFGPVISAAEARTMSEFLPGGISSFFVEESGHFWFTAQRSGMLPRLGTAVPLIIGVWLPVLMLFPAIFPLVKQVTKDVAVLLQITLASVAMFLASHALLFRLHLPSRYTEHSLRIVTAIASGIVLTLILDAVLNWAGKPPVKSSVSHHQEHQPTSVNLAPWRQLVALGAVVLLVGGPILHPIVLKRFPRTDYMVGNAPALYEFFQQQPKDSLIASLTKEGSNLPIFAQRSILAGGEGYPVPYHKGYYAKIRQRTIDLIEAQYSPDLATVQRFIQKYGVDFWLLETGAWTLPYLTNERWIMQYKPAAENAIATLQQGTLPALASLTESCQVLQTGNFIVLQAECIAKVR